MSAAREYKAVVGGLTTAADALREHDRARAGELARELVERERVLRRAAERAALSRLGVELHWEAALEALWEETWMTLRPRPSGGPESPGEDLDALDAAVAQRFDELLDAVRRRRLGLRR